MTNTKKRFTKLCPQCSAEQSYGRAGHLADAVRGNWCCKSCSNKSNKIEKKHNDIPLSWFNTKVKGATSRGYGFTFTVEQLWELYVAQGKVCALSGRSIGWGKGVVGATASIDRINSTRGYDLCNVQLVHKYVNMMKQQYSQELFLQLCCEVALRAPKAPTSCAKCIW